MQSTLVLLFVMLHLSSILLCSFIATVINERVTLRYFINKQYLQITCYVNHTPHTHISVLYYNNFTYSEIAKFAKFSTGIISENSRTHQLCKAGGLPAALIFQ